MLSPRAADGMPIEAMAAVVIISRRDGRIVAIEFAFRAKTINAMRPRGNWIVILLL
jgi:hypothetical protein